MDALTSYLFSEQELSLDANLDSMLANLPQQAEGMVNLDPIVPFQNLYNNDPGTFTESSKGVAPSMVQRFGRPQCCYPTGVAIA